MKHGIGRGHALRGIRGRSSRRGTAIIPALVTVVIVATLSMVFLQLSLAKNKEQRASVDSKRAFYLAEAGLSEGFNGLCLGKSGNVASKDLPAEFGNGLFWTTATENGQGHVTLECTGLCGAGRATLSEVVERRSETVSSLGFFGDQNIAIEAGATIDSYDSQVGPYIALPIPIGGLLTSGARVGCNGDITVQGTLLSPTTILGDVKPGPQGTLFRSRYATVSGAITPNTAVASFPPVKVPDAPSLGDLIVTSTKTAANLQKGRFSFGELRVKTGASLNILGPLVIVAKQLRVDSGARLTLDSSGGPIKIIVTDRLEFDSSSALATTSTDPMGIAIQVASTDSSAVSLDTKGTFYGSIYAPKADMTVPAGLTVFGALTAWNLTIKAGGKLHFDRALANSVDDENGTPRLQGWHIVELPNVPVVNLRFDALRELRELGLNPKKGSDSHFDIGVIPN